VGAIGTGLKNIPVWLHFLLPNEATCEYLTSRWHDQVLDLKSVHHDILQRNVRFIVLEEVPERKSPVVAFGRIGLFSVPIQSTVVTLSPIEDVRLNCDTGDTDLLISRVECESRFFRIHGMNGDVEVVGEMMQLSLEPLSKAPKVGRVVDLGLFELSWTSRRTWRREWSWGNWKRTTHCQAVERVAFSQADWF